MKSFLLNIHCCKADLQICACHLSWHGLWLLRYARMPSSRLVVNDHRFNFVLILVFSSINGLEK
jgi:hypothetical protein